jgi:hypothetical protein
MIANLRLENPMNPLIPLQGMEGILKALKPQRHRKKHFATQRLQSQWFQWLQASERRLSSGTDEPELLSKLELLSQS